MTATTAPAAPTRRWRRRRIIVLALVVLVPVSAFGLLRWALQPERLGALLLARAAQATGLELAVAQPARLGIWPQLQLELVGLSARAEATDAPLLQAERVDVSLPLSLLWRQQELPLGEVHLRAPRFDLAAWQRWREATAPATPAPLQLPDIAVDLQITNGTLHTRDWRIDDVSLVATPLHDGQPFRLDATASLHHGESVLPLLIHLRTLPRQTSEGVMLQVESLHVAADQAVDVAELAGEIDLRLPDALRIALEGRVGTAWPGTWPALPEQIAPYLLGQPIVLSYTGAPDFSGVAGLQSRSEQRQFGMEAAPTELAAWLAADPRPPLPPLTATLQLDTLDYEGVRLDGVSVRIDPAAAGE
jgi:hypothetical protein